MNNSSDGKSMALGLCSAWQALLDGKDLPAEIAYRIHKMVQRIRPIVDKLFLKTPKGQEMLRECAQKMTGLQDHLEADEDRLYYLLTDLERTCEELIGKTYEFRVKAG